MTVDRTETSPGTRAAVSEGGEKTILDLSFSSEDMPKERSIAINQAGPPAAGDATAGKILPPGPCSAEVKGTTFLLARLLFAPKRDETAVFAGEENTNWPCDLFCSHYTIAPPPNSFTRNPPTLLALLVRQRVLGSHPNPSVADDPASFGSVGAMLLITGPCCGGQDERRRDEGEETANRLHKGLRVIRVEWQTMLSGRLWRSTDGKGSRRTPDRLGSSRQATDELCVSVAAWPPAHTYSFNFCWQQIKSTKSCAFRGMNPLPLPQVTVGRGRGGLATRMLAFHQGEPGSILGGDTTGFRTSESCRTMPLFGRCFFFSLGVFPFPPALAFRSCSIPTSLHPRRLSIPQCFAVAQTAPINELANFDAAVRVAEGVLGDALVGSEVRRDHGPDSQLHVHLVGVVQERGLVLVSYSEHTHTHHDTSRVSE
ncbi:hypothetical protein PR048_032292 [Dryococelus australis]|uniref:Uncharacterized protein n=1 Tax=Dryococelus australis TaxID=614101 RepID=A0ABQ9G1U9_9NEOP|nr:hypothetical protein PR048_032292 [Dryococelus australis]